MDLQDGLESVRRWRGFLIQKKWASGEAGEFPTVGAGGSGTPLGSRAAAPTTPLPCFPAPGFPGSGSWWRSQGPEVQEVSRLFRSVLQEILERMEEEEEGAS